jgi:rhamnulose-1-phosphate aldolase
LHEPYPDLDELFASIGEAGLRLSSIAASEGAAGNISLAIGWPLEVRSHFPFVKEISLPEAVPALVGKQILITGSGRRLRDIHLDPTANLGVVTVAEDGLHAHLYTSPNCLFERVTSEFNSHLAVHADQIARTGTNFHALIHAQPPHLVYLSHIQDYRDQELLNRHLFRWEEETIIQLPEGVGVIPFLLTGSPELMQANVTHLREHQLVLWCKHGVMARSAHSVARAADLIEYMETAARYEYMNLLAGSRAEGLTQDELRAVVQSFNVSTSLL